MNDLLRLVEQEDSQAFAIMAVPDQKADNRARTAICQKKTWN